MQKDLLKQMLRAVIADKTDQANDLLSQYITDKTRSLVEGEHKFKAGDVVKLAHDGKDDYGHFLGKEGKIKSVSMKRKGVRTYIVKFGSDDIVCYEPDLKLVNKTVQESAKIKEFKLTLDKASESFKMLSNKEKHDALFSEGDNSGEGNGWVWDQDVVTIEDIRVVGNTVYVSPYWDEDKGLEDGEKLQAELQDSLDDWVMENT